MIFDYLVAIIFGIVEGITEWLPISSTGHMILLNELLPLNVSEEFYSLFEVVIQLGAIMAVVVLFWNEIWPFGAKGNEHPLNDSKFGKLIKKDKFIMWFKILVACIPAAVVGVLFDDVFERLFYNYVCVAIALIVFGVAFIIVENYAKNRKFRINSIEEISFPMAFLIGVFQLLAAIFPGTSRSGSTIVGSVASGVNRSTAAKFTFFLAIPVMFGASLLKIVTYDGSVSANDIGLLVVGLVVSFIVSFFVIKKLMSYIRKHDFKIFGVYRIILGAVVLAAGLLNII